MPGKRVAVAVGSRGIANLVCIVREIVAVFRDRRLDVSIVSAMGSHGGGTSDGQRAVLAALGITEIAVGAPIDTEMDVFPIGETDDGVPVMVGTSLVEYDAVVPVNRVKPHTDYSGTVESGICKMLAIGFGRHDGCSRLHEEGFDAFARLIPEAASVVLNSVHVPFGLAIIENAYDRTEHIEAIPGGAIIQREPELLARAYRNMPRLRFRYIDVLIIDEIGKDISGAGMDPNIVGRTAKGVLPGFTGPLIDRIIVAGITPVSHGNAIGVGLADFVLEPVAAVFDRESTYANAIASGNPESGRMPIVFPDLEDAVRAALMTSRVRDWRDASIVRIKNTLELGEIAVSEPLLSTVDSDSAMTRL